MKLKTILFSLSIITFYTPCTFSKQAKKKKTVDKSSFRYTLKIDKQTFYLKENKEAIIQLAGKQYKVLLQPPIAQVFEQKGIYFQYPIHMRCTYDKKESEEDLKMWDIEGYDSMLMLQKYLNQKKSLILPFALSLKEGWDKTKKSVKIKKIVTNYHQKTIKGYIFEIIDANDQKLIQEVYELKTSKDSLIIILQDVRDDSDVPTKEFVSMKKLFFATFKNR